MCMAYLFSFIPKGRIRRRPAVGPQHLLPIDRSIYLSCYGDQPALPPKQFGRAPTIEARAEIGLVGIGMAGADQKGATAEPGPPLPPVGLVFDEDCQLHAPPERFNGKPAIEHAERPERTRVIWEAVVKAGLDRQCERLAPREATREEALTCHSCEHVDALNALEHEQPATRRLWKVSKFAWYSTLV